MVTVTINSFVEFIRQTDFMDLVAELVVFRGQPVKGNLLPTIARAKPADDTTRREKQTLEQLKLQGASFLVGAEASDLELLVRAQHYGLKTRLLDWTINPLAALWFACSDTADGDVFVYGLVADDLLAEDVYKQDPFESAETRVFQPRLNNPRIVAQQGWFTLHRYAAKNKRFVRLEENPKVKDSLYEYRVPAVRRPELLSALDRHGVSAKTVFPDLGGLCQHLNWKYENKQ